MAVTIRLARGGSKKRPFYRIVAADSRMARDGRYLEKLGIYAPLLPKDAPERVKMDVERVQYWLGQGAQVTDRIARMLEAAGLKPKAVRANPNKGTPGKNAVERVASKAAKVVKAAEAAAAPAPVVAAVVEEAAPEPVAEVVAADEAAVAPVVEAVVADDAAAEPVVDAVVADDAVAEDVVAEDVVAEETVADEAASGDVADEAPAE